MYKIQRIQNCLPEPLLTEITNFIHNANWKYGWNSNGNMGFSHWNFNISKTGSENGLDISAVPIATCHFSFPQNLNKKTWCIN